MIMVINDLAISLKLLHKKLILISLALKKFVSVKNEEITVAKYGSLLYIHIH